MASILKDGAAMRRSFTFKELFDVGARFGSSDYASYTLSDPRKYRVLLAVEGATQFRGKGAICV